MADQDTRIFSDRFDHVVQKNLTSSTRRDIVRHIGKVLAKPRVSQGLDVPAPGIQIYLGGNDPGDDRGEIFQMSGLDIKDLAQAYADVPYFKPEWKIMRNEFNWAMTLIIRRMVLDSARPNEISMCVFFLTVHFVASLISKYFPFTPNENIMNYAINSMSNKFMLKQMGSLRRALEYISDTSHKTHVKELRKGTDNDLKKYFLNLRIRLNNIFRTFKNHYMTVKEEGSYLNLSRDFYDSGKMVDRESHYGMIEMLAHQTSQRFISEPLSYKVLGQSARIAGVTMTSLRSVLESARSSEKEIVQEIVTKLLELFFEEQKGSKGEINTRKFTNFYLAVYVRSNTKDQRVKVIKERLNHLLMKHGSLYRKTEREATRNSYRKAVYVYLCLLLQIMTRGG